MYTSLDVFNHVVQTYYVDMFPHSIQRSVTRTPIYTCESFFVHNRSCICIQRTDGRVNLLIGKATEFECEENFEQMEKFCMCLNETLSIFKLLMI